MTPKTLLITSHSVGAPHELLAKITVPVMEDYCKLHGYALAVNKSIYEESHVPGLLAIIEQLKDFDIVVTLGADVLITNHQLGFEYIGTKKTILTECGYAGEPDSALIIAREHLGWWPINNDVAIWRRSSVDLLRRLVNDREIWLRYPWLWQNHLWNLIQTEDWVREAVQIVPARVMNSTHQPGLSRWQLGDFIIHFLDMPIEEKIRWATFYRQFVGDATFIPQEPTGD
jgi:hypothetical protein